MFECGNTIEISTLPKAATYMYGNSLEDSLQLMILQTKVSFSECVLMVPMFLSQLQKHYQKQIRELRQSVEVLRAKEEQLSADKEALK